MSISLVSQRVFHGNADISVAVADYRVGTYSMTYTAGQYLHIGTVVPMTNLWIEMPTASTTASGLPVVEVRWGNAWVPVQDIIDQTNEMQLSGRISWSVDYFKGWDLEQKSSDVGIVGSNVYDRYWCRISWPNSFSAVFAYLGQKFSNDLSLAGSYPDLVLNSQLLTGFKAGKTNWDEQHFMAADKILKDLKKRKFVKDEKQVFDWQALEDASCHKVADIVYAAFGTPYRDHMNLARKAYEDEMGRVMNLDSNMNGKLDDLEIADSVGWMTR